MSAECWENLAPPNFGRGRLLLQAVKARKRRSALVRLAISPPSARLAPNDGQSTAIWPRSTMCSQTCVRPAGYTVGPGGSTASPCAAGLHDRPHSSPRSATRYAISIRCSRPVPHGGHKVGTGRRHKKRFLIPWVREDQSPHLGTRLTFPGPPRSKQHRGRPARVHQRSWATSMWLASRR